MRPETIKYQFIDKRHWKHYYEQHQHPTKPNYQARAVKLPNFLFNYFTILFGYH